MPLFLSLVELYCVSLWVIFFYRLVKQDKHKEADTECGRCSQRDWDEGGKKIFLTPKIAWTSLDVSIRHHDAITIKSRRIIVVGSNVVTKLFW